MRKPELQGSPHRPPLAGLDAGWDKPERAGARIGDVGAMGLGRKTTADQPIFSFLERGQREERYGGRMKGSNPFPPMVGRFSSEKVLLRGIKGRSSDRLESFISSFLSIRLHFTLRILPTTNRLSYKQNLTTLHFNSSLTHTLTFT